MRAEEKGWIRVAKLDKAQRRSLWVRLDDNKIELCAGREGDDAYAVIYFSGGMGPQELAALRDVVETAEWALEMDSDDVG